MRIFDAHCDVLMKLWENKGVSFKHECTELHITMDQLQRTHAKVQCFAIFIPEYVKKDNSFQVALEMVDIFFKKVLAENRNMRLIRSKEDIHRLKDDEIGAVLTLEGGEAIQSDPVKLRTLLRLGVRSVGLTWNYANTLADGVLEPRGAGLTSFGRKVIDEINTYKLWTDVSHLSEAGFWDVMNCARYPIATHSNVKAICDNPRNLNDEQILELIRRDGMIGVTFVPQFLTTKRKAEIVDVLEHLDYICGLGGENQLGFGSDFDGITETVKGLSSYKEYVNLINELQKHYSEEQVEKFLYLNWFHHFPA
ncbi:membrane dipeptidase [Bacillus sp. HMF5848]|uniref:dipeptidase n=1 Tax=Bacillus sp. HMF5848 TaxID=2495421 RepID=UPI000F77720E|nr:dipeptidase [Bacillus sp. HMF5848]RSK27102.1 membrane dipeptidase [Bacillus sp. HMF5848]